MRSEGASLVLGSVERERVLTVLSDDVPATRRELVAEADLCSPVPTVVSVQWGEAPPPDERQEHVLRAVAEAAQSLWPRWYATVDERIDRERWPSTEIESRLQDALAAAPGVRASWFRRAWRQCQRGRAPVVRATPAAEQLRQLALALDPTGPILVLAVSSPEAPPERIHALARTAEWLAAQSETRTLLIVPAAWRDSRELDAVSYRALEHHPAPEPEVAAGPQPAKPAGASAPEVTVEPHVGSPHPGSEAEKRLHDLLVQDSELSSLFEFNRSVLGFDNTRFLVDLVWREGKVVVEVDGPEHRSAARYRADRERDYRLLTAGYAVVRTTNDDVLEDAALVVAKLRNVVRLRRQT